MNIVANTFFLRKLRNLPFFTLDLGKSRKLVNDDDNRFRKISEFHIKYKNLYGNQIMDFGSIGNKIKFHEDVNIKGNKYFIFNNEDVYEIDWTESEVEDLENYILETLRKVSEAENEEEVNEEINVKKIEEYAESNDIWVAQDEKNSGRKYIVDQTLSKEAYREELLKKMGKS